VHCYDEFGVPLVGIPGAAFAVTNLTGNMVEFGTPDLATIATDDLGRVSLTEKLEASATLVHGSIAVVVSVGGEDVAIDNGGGGIPVEFRSPDLNHDGLVDRTDLTIFIMAFDCCTDTEFCQQCDFNGDGCVTLADQVILMDHYAGIQNGTYPRTFATDKAARTDLFVGCIQRDFDEDDGPDVLRDEIILLPGQPVVLKLLVKDFTCMTGVDFEMAIPSGLILNGTVTAITPFTNYTEQSAPAGSIAATLMAPYITSGLEFMCEIPLLCLTAGIYYTSDFVFGDVVFTDCSYPPLEVAACIGTPTPCDMSYLVQGSGQFISCPGNDLSVNDIVTVVMRDQYGDPVPDLPDDGFQVSLDDTLGSGRADAFSMTPLGPATDVNGELDFLFERRGTCRWPDACLSMHINMVYEGCSLDIHKTVQTLNLVRYDPSDGQQDLIDDVDLDTWYTAKFTDDFCLDLSRQYRCPW